MEQPRFTFHPLTEGDLPLLCDWLNRPHIRAWWGDVEVVLEEVRDEYLPVKRDDATARPYLACIDGQPTGFIQYYFAWAGSEAWWPDNPNKGVVGIDQFLANESRLGQGLGSAMVSQFATLLLLDPEVHEIRVDPHPDNIRAIRCYRRAGFRVVRPITTPDGPAIMMVLSRAQNEERY